MLAKHFENENTISRFFAIFSGELSGLSKAQKNCGPTGQDEESEERGRIAIDPNINGRPGRPTCHG